MSVDEERKVVFDLIEAYRKHRLLWDTSHSHYKNSFKKKSAYESLRKIYQRFKPDATLEDVARKIHTIRTNYSRNRRTYTQTIYYYDAMSFLDPILDIRSRKNKNVDYNKEMRIEKEKRLNKEKKITEHQKLILEFIDSYREHTILWDPSHIDYCHSVKRDSAYAECTEVLRKIDPAATVKKTVKQIRSLRSNYVRERKRRKQLRNCSSGSQESDDNKPSLFYYEAMSFLNPVLDAPKKEKYDLSQLFPDISQFSEQSAEQNAIDSSMCSSDQNLQPQDNLSETEFQFSTKSNFVDVSNAPQSHDTRNFNPLNDSDRERKASPSTKDRRSIKHFYEEDDADVFGRAWTTQFRSLSEDQKVYAKKAIDDILFEAKLGTLHRRSIQINDNLCQHCQTAFVNFEDKLDNTKN